MRALALFVSAFLVLAVPAAADNPTPYPGTRSVDTGKPFEAFLKDLEAAVTANEPGIVAEATT